MRKKGKHGEWIVLIVVLLIIPVFFTVSLALADNPNPQLHEELENTFSNFSNQNGIAYVHDNTVSFYDHILNLEDLDLEGEIVAVGAYQQNIYFAITANEQTKLCIYRCDCNGEQVTEIFVKDGFLSGGLVRTLDCFYVNDGGKPLFYVQNKKVCYTYDISTGEFCETNEIAYHNISKIVPLGDNTYRYQGYEFELNDEMFAESCEGQALLKYKNRKYECIDLNGQLFVYCRIYVAFSDYFCAFFEYDCDTQELNYICYLFEIEKEGEIFMYLN